MKYGMFSIRLSVFDSDITLISEEGGSGIFVPHIQVAVFFLYDERINE